MSSFLLTLIRNCQNIAAIYKLIYIEYKHIDKHIYKHISY